MRSAGRSRRSSGKAARAVACGSLACRWWRTAMWRRRRNATQSRASAYQQNNRIGRNCAMDDSGRIQSIDRRLFLGASASTLLAMPALAQNEAKPDEAKPGETKPAAPAPDAKRLSQMVAEFVAGFDLKTVPQVVIDRARVAITDTVGVMLAGSRQDVSHILCDMVRLEGATPSASIVGQSLRTS